MVHAVVKPRVRGVGKVVGPVPEADSRGDRPVSFGEDPVLRVTRDVPCPRFYCSRYQVPPRHHPLDPSPP